MADLKDLPKAYEAASVEDKIYAEWEASGAFNPDTLSKLSNRYKKGDPFCIMMPPPNVTGVLHLGHALENSLMDTMARFQRMRGKRVLLLPGTDHAAIATQAKVEKMLMEQGMKNPRKELGREKLVEKIREFAEESKTTIISQMRKMGTSADWSRLAYTFDDKRNIAVKELFVRMYNDGLIYRGYRVVNWSVKGQSTCSDDEIEYVERPSKLYTFKYSKDFPITIATTRPETKLGDTAVAVHPKDKRYKKMIGQTITVDVGASKSLQIRIIADENVDPEFGTGALGVTPAHSAVDFAMYEKQKAKGEPIAIIPVIGLDGKMTADAGKNYEGLNVEQARAKFVAWLQSQNLLEKEEDIMQSVGTSDRYGDLIEFIPMTQWWLDMNKVIPKRGKNLRELMRAAVGKDGIKITPEHFTRLYLDRVDNLRDWCLSRQLWWGHRIPVWYKGEEMYVGIKAPTGGGWEQDPDTLDTWFSSGSWCFSTLGWPEKTIDLKTFHPTAWMQMGYEILYLWLMRMVLMSEYALKQIPFKNAYIHGILRDEYGKKFSKSSGNGIDPIEVINKYGCDALRISLLMGTSPGNDSKYYTEKIESGRNFTNKLWNISRFIMIQLGDVGVRTGKPEFKTDADHWVFDLFSNAIFRSEKSLNESAFSLNAEILRDFTWGELADWYLEIAKFEKDKEVNLSIILTTLLKLWHPLMPFVTEHIWKTANMKGQLMTAEWPKHKTMAGQFEKSGLDRTQARKFNYIIKLITDIRRFRAENGIEAAKKVEFVLSTPSLQRDLLERNLKLIENLVGASSLEIVDEIQTNLKTFISQSTTIGLNIAGAIDVAKERAKIEKELGDLKTYVASTQAKLKNKEFASKAPEQVVAGMRAKLEEAKAKVKALEARLHEMPENG